VPISGDVNANGFDEIEADAPARGTREPRNIIASCSLKAALALSRHADVFGNFALILRHPWPVSRLAQRRMILFF